MSVVIVPAYKPDQTLKSITNKLWKYGCQIIVVDDGSGEEYQQVFDQVGDICIVLYHRENLGKYFNLPEHTGKLWCLGFGRLERRCRLNLGQGIRSC